MRYLLNVTEKYRVDTEEEAQALIDEAKKASVYELTKYSSTAKENKRTEETWYVVSLTKIFQTEKEPTDVVEPTYTKKEWEFDY